MNYTVEWTQQGVTMTAQFAYLRAALEVTAALRMAGYTAQIR